MSETYLRRFSISLLLVASAFASSSCAGELTETEKDNFLNENPNTTMAGGNGGAGGAGGSGSAEAGPGVDISCVKTFFEKKCTSCHGDDVMTVPGLSLLGADLSDPSKFIGIEAKGDGDEMGCVELKALWIDPVNPDKSLLYSKLSNGACGAKMPATGANVTANEKACVLSWVNSLIVANGSGTTGSGTTGSGTTGSGAGGAGGAGGATGAGGSATTTTAGGAGGSSGGSAGGAGGAGGDGGSGGMSGAGGAGGDSGARDSGARDGSSGGAGGAGGARDGGRG